MPGLDHGLSESEAKHAYLLRLSDALRPLADAIAIQATACRLLGQQLRVDRAYYAEVDEGQKVARPRDFYQVGATRSIGSVYPLCDYRWSLPLLRQGRAIVVSDVQAATLIPAADVPAMAALQIRALVSVPVVKGGALVGVVCITDPGPRAWSDTDVELVQETAERTWSSVMRANAEGALRASEARFRTLFETMGQGYTDAEIVCDADGCAVDYRFLEVNPAFERLVGVPSAQARGRTARQVFPGLEDWWVQAFDRLVRQGVPGRVEHEVASLGRWYCVHIYPEEGRRFTALYEEITDSKRAEAAQRLGEERQAFLLQLSDALRPLTVPAAIQSTAARLLGQQLQVSSAGYCEVEADEDICVVGGEYGDGRVRSLAGQRARLSDQCPGFGPALRAGESVASADIRSNPKSHPGGSAEAASLGIVSGAGVPLLRNGHLVAFFYLAHLEPRRWSERELDLLREVAERTWAAVERARAEQALREQESVVRGQKEAFQAAMNGRELSISLGVLSGTVREVIGSECRAAFFRVGENGSTLHHVVGMPEAYACRVDGLPVGPESMSCGLAAYIGEPVFAPDVEQDSRWKPLLELAREYGYRASWSFPVRTAGGPILGTLALYFPHPREPAAREMSLIVSVTHAAAIIVSRHAEVQHRTQAEQSLRDSDRRKDEFLATLAHELRNPLAPLCHGLQVLKLAHDDLSVFEGLRTMMERQLGQMVHLIDDLLDLSRISRGKVDLRTSCIDLADAVQQAIETSRPLIEAGKHQLTVRPPRHAIHVEADLIRLAQVFANLLNNAAKYTPGGGQISVVIEQHGDEAVVSVCDTGVGIPAHQLADVFEMFAQVDRSLGHSQGGLGIGLSLARRLVEMHGGRITAGSAGPGQGSTFVVRLPVARPATLVTSAGPADTTAGLRVQHRILVVDDNRDAANMLAWMLAAMGHETLAVHNGREALESATRFHPDAVLLDIGMPGLDGYETCRLLRTQEGGHRMVILAQTGWGQEEDKQRSREAGFDFHLVKPVDPQELDRLLACG